MRALGEGTHTFAPTGCWLFCRWNLTDGVPFPSLFESIRNMHGHLRLLWSSRISLLGTAMNKVRKREDKHVVGERVVWEQTNKHLSNSCTRVTVCHVSVSHRHKQAHMTLPLHSPWQHDPHSKQPFNPTHPACPDCIQCTEPADMAQCPYRPRWASHANW